MKLHATILGSLLGMLVGSTALAASTLETHEGFYMQLQGGLGDEWSAGVMGRLIYAPLSLNNVDYTVIEPAVVATFTYH